MVYLPLEITKKEIGLPFLSFRVALKTGEVLLKLARWHLARLPGASWTHS